MKLTNHAISRYAERTGIDFLTAAEELNSTLKSDDVIECNAVAVERFGFTVKKARKHKYDVFYVWKEPLINNDYMCAVKQRGAIVTVMTTACYAFRNENKLTKNRLKTL